EPAPPPGAARFDHCGGTRGLRNLRTDPTRTNVQLFCRLVSLSSPLHTSARSPTLQWSNAEHFADGRVAFVELREPLVDDVFLLCAVLGAERMLEVLAVVPAPRLVEPNERGEWLPAIRER